MFRIESCAKQVETAGLCRRRRTCPRKGRLLYFDANSAATSDGGAQKLGNDVRRNSESIATKVCSQIGCK